MNWLRQLPEVAALVAPDQLIRVPDQKDVPVTPRVRRLIDTAAFARLRGISQLGLVGYVYPGAVHSRFEHSLGVYLNALLYLQQMARYDAVQQIMDPAEAECFLVSALLHDLGHWPYCHPIEDLQLAGWPVHEETAARFLESEQLRRCLREDWGLEPRQVLDLLNKRAGTKGQRLLSSILSGPIDVDKLDYLYRDSLHAGVPYGRQFDTQRVIASLCLNATGDGIAIMEKGRTAAELMVFARYIMFSEVYWHPTVRSATAMLQRVVYLQHSQLSPERWLEMGDAEVRQWLVEQTRATTAGQLCENLFGPQRCLYKRLLQFSYFEQPEWFNRLSRRPYGELLELSEHLAACLSRASGRSVSREEILVDAPPQGLEVQFKVTVKMESTGQFRALGEISPVVQALATKQFDDFVKQVRVFVHPRLVDFCSPEQLRDCLHAWQPEARTA
jgi:HD superfamily phosphohydrolase